VEDARRTITHNWDWWAYQFRVIHRSGIPGISEYDDRLVAFIIDVLGLEPGVRVLDVGCGSGAHALRLAREGMQVVGLDVAPSLVGYCRDRAAADGLSAARFVQGDMRDMQAALGNADPFDAAVVLSTSFGFFDDTTNRWVLQSIVERLRPGGLVLLQLMDPIRFAERQREAVYQEDRAEGSYWTETWFDPATFVSHSRFRFTDSAGIVHLWDDHERIRVYTLPELSALMLGVGLVELRAYGDVALPPRVYGIDCSRQLIVAASRPGGEV
jgi:SAM-dependent methyltransferase